MFEKVALLARYLISRRNNDVIFKLAESENERRQSYDLRYQVYCVERGYLSKDKYSNGLETDSFDNGQNTVNVIAVSGERVVGLLRLVFAYTESDSLPSEKYFKLEKHYKQKVGELTRLIVSRDYRGNPRVLFGLVKTAIISAGKIGIENFCISVSQLWIKRYELFGFKKISGPYYYSEIHHDKPSFTMYLNIDTANKNMRRTNPVFAMFLRRKTEEILV